MRFPPSFIERLRQHFVMSDVVGRRIPLKQFGREYKACCPFHQEKTPSFTVNNEKGFFHCFGCGVHGDAIEFVRRYERLTYPEAIEKLAAEGGLALPERSPLEEKKARAEKTLFDVLEAACAWYEQQLSSSGGTVARDYLEKRGLRPETIRTFRIGYAPNEPRLLYNHLKQAGFNDQLQAEAGLISMRDESSVYDRFRGRVIFPIRSGRGKVIAFGGRLLQAGSNPNLPKYLNSPETPLFKKREMLFNLDLAKTPAREHNMLVVMEGYTDVVAAYQAGIHYSVATLGTAVTSDHLHLLWQLAKEPVICLDGDEAGKRAMRKTVELCMPLLAPGKSLRFAVLPAGEDPDSYISKNGKQGFERILAGSGRLSQTIWETYKAGFDLTLPEGRAALEDTL
ncbi:MAG: DNA primase [Alphaproteobacteria bacterium]